MVPIKAERSKHRSVVAVVLVESVDEVAVAVGGRAVGVLDEQLESGLQLGQARGEVRDHSWCVVVVPVLIM